MGVLKVNIDSGISDDTLAQNYERSTSAKYADVQAIAQLLEGVVSGNVAGNSTNATPPTVNVSVEGKATRASGTFILTSVVTTDAVSINGVTFTAVASNPSTNEFVVGANDNATAANLAAAINASATALVSGYVTAAKTTTTLTPATVTVYSTNYGIYGNQTLIASADSTIVASGARLTGGAVDSGAKSYTF